MNSWFTFLKPAGSGIRALRAFSSVGGPTLFRQASNPNWFVVNKRYEVASTIVATFATDASDKRPKRQNNTNKTPNAPKTIAQKKNKPKDLFDKSRQTNTIRAKRREDRRSGFPKTTPQTITRFPPPSTPTTTTSSSSSQLVAPKPAVTVDAYSVGQPSLRTDSQSDLPTTESNTPLTADVMKKFIAGELSVEEIAALPEGPLHRLMGSEGYAEWKNTFIPYNISAQQIEFAAKVFTRQAVHVKDVRSMENLPPTIWPEVAFAGRSNVGKSSLLNAIFSNRSLAFVSNTPGRTQALQFYSLPIRGLKHGIVYHSQETHKMFRDGTIQKGQDELHIVDMPGYGFTKAPPSVSQHWQQLVGEYVASRLTLKRIFILIDARHGLKQIDKDFMNFLDTVGKSYQVVLTKSDKLSATSIQEMIEVTQKEVRNRAACHPFIISTSSKNKEGIDVLRASICTSSGIYRDYLYTNSEATSSDASSLDELNRFEESLTEKGVMDMSHSVLGAHKK